MVEKLNKLKAILEKYPGIVVAFSGGVDSSLLLKIAKDVLKNHVIAVTVVSPLQPKDEITSARKVAKKLKCRHVTVRLYVFKDSKFIYKSPNRCYYCKIRIFKKIKTIANKHGYGVIEASNKSDLSDYRPGLNALKKLGIKSPFIMTGFDKNEIRFLAKKFHLENWNKPSAACLASRIPYGRKINKKILKRVELAERYLKNLKLTQVRVRDHYPIARIEVQTTDLKKILHYRDRIVKYLKRLGYKFISLDLEGYQIGSLNR